MTNDVKHLLGNFFGNCEEINDNEYSVHIGPPSGGYDALFKFSKDSITVLNLLTGIDTDTLQIISHRVLGKNKSINLDITENSLNFSTRWQGDLRILEDTLDIVRNIFREFMTYFPKKSWMLLGEIQLNILGNSISILSEEYNDVIRTGWRGDIIAILRHDNWVISNIGRDHVDLPILTISDGNIFTFAPTKDGDHLEPINLTKIIQELSSLLDFLGVQIIDLPKDESELFRKLGQIIGLLDSIKLLKSGGDFSLLPIKLDEEKIKVIEARLKEIESKVDAIRRIFAFDGVVRKKIALKIAAQYAREILHGEKGVIVSNVRKVSKLGAGKAIYIGKEELKAIPLGEKVLVSVIEDKGRRKIVIEPL